MKQVMLNIALFDLIRFCKQHELPCSGTTVKKANRGYTYTLVKFDTGKAIASVTYSRSQCPRYALAEGGAE